MTITETRNVDARIGRARGKAAVVKRELMKGNRTEADLAEAMEELRITVAEVNFERAATELLAEFNRGNVSTSSISLIAELHSKAVKADIARSRG